MVQFCSSSGVKELRQLQRVQDKTHEMETNRFFSLVEKTQAKEISEKYFLQIQIRKEI